MDPAGSYLYVANTGSNNISVFSIDSSTGALTQLIEFSDFLGWVATAEYAADAVGQLSLRQPSQADRSAPLMGRS